MQLENQSVCGTAKAWAHPLVDVGDGVGKLRLQDGLARPLLSATFTRFSTMSGFP